MQWHDTQSLIARALLDRPEAVARPDPNLAALFTSGAAILPERLKIYRNNVMGNLTAALRSTYPLIEKLTGEEFTSGMFRAYILAHPPQAACLNRYGAGLDAFIKTFVPAQSLSYLTDVARLEWALNEAYYAPDDQALTPADLKDTAHEELADLIMPLRSSVRLLASRWPLQAIRDFCLKENRDESETLDLDQGGCRIMVYRSGLAVDVLPLEHAEYTMLLLLRDGISLGEACEIIFPAFPDFALQDFLQKFLKLETFSTNNITSKA
jgi:hypothetical protein